MFSIFLSALALTCPASIQEPSPSQAPPPKVEKVKADTPKTAWEYLAAKYDSNKDGKIAKDEYSRGETQFLRLDKDKNGFIEKADTKIRSPRQRGRGKRSRANPPQEGSVAPDFVLETLYPLKTKANGTDKTEPAVKDSKKKDSPKTEPAQIFESLKLSSFAGKKPVALIFGSYT